MQASKIVIFALVPAFLVALPARARADCAEGSGYDATVNGNTVQIEVFGDPARSCPDPGGMLRQAEPGGAIIVKLADFCTTGNNPAYVDECVPPGTYFYGYATPFTCDASACGGTPYYTAVTVTQPLSASCMRSSGDAGPTTATSVPWGTSSLVCASSEGSSSSGSSSSSGGTGGAGGSSSSGGSAAIFPKPGSSGSGCAMGLPRGAVPVLSGNLLALIAGLALMRRRRGQKP